MQEKSFKNGTALARAAADVLCGVLAQKPGALFCLAAGHSSLPVFEALMERQNAGVDFSQARFVSMDEWAGLGRENPEGCSGFLLRHFLGPMGFPPERTRLFDGTALDPAQECAGVVRQIEEWGGVDFMLLGMGMNGHIALNEPGCDLAAGARVVDLDDTTKQVGQKYFLQPVRLEWGLTLGVADILRSRRILLVIQGAHKAAILHHFLEEPVSNGLPATALKQHPDAQLYTAEV